MKVLLDCERMRYPYTGLYEYCLQLGTSLKGLMGRDSLEYYLPEAEVGVFGDDSQYFIQKSRHKLLPPKKKYDIVSLTFQLTRYTSIASRSKAVLTVHDLNFLYEKTDVQKIKKYLSKVQHNIDRADHLIVISNYTKEDVMTHLDTRNKPMSVVYNGCCTEEFPGYEKPEAYVPQKPFLFSLGMVVPKKNFHSVPALLVGNDYELLIAGRIDETYKNIIFAEAKRHGVADRVKLLGAVSKQDKYWYLKNCLAFVFPSKAEGFGMPAIEAMHFGRPVFLSTSTSLPEIGGAEAYYFPDFDPSHMQAVFEQGMNNFNSNPQKSSALIERSNLFTWEKCARGYLDIYRTLEAQK